jgi:hypothetical protein
VVDVAQIIDDLGMSDIAEPEFEPFLYGNVGFPR